MPSSAPRRAGPEHADDLKQELVVEFGSVLDESVIIAIVGDYDVVTQNSEIRTILTSLAEDAPVEAATGFDETGLGCLAEIENALRDETTNSSPDAPGSGSGSLECSTSISEFSDAPEETPFTYQANPSEDEKLRQLRLIFSLFKDHTIKLALKRNNGDLDHTFDDLLNRQLLAEQGLIPKGVDGFYVSDDEEQPGPSKGKSKGKGKAARSQKGTSKKLLPINYSVVSATINNSELEGAKDFASPSPGGRAANSQAKRPPLPSLQSAGGSWNTAPTTVQRVLSPVSPVGTNEVGSHLRAAAALSRKGGLARQGAIVYLERAREEARRATARSSEMADRIVDEQSKADTIDLHGVSVSDGVRIASDRLWRWWRSLGENREAQARQEGFTIITGIGRHSAGGVSRLRQAVGIFLRNDGWKVETLTGKFLVAGRV